MGGIEAHGGNVHLASRRLGLSIEQIVDFSANINPLGPSPLALEAIQNNLHLIGHYPDPDCSALIEELARYLHVDAELIVAGNGGAEVIQLVADVLCPANALIPSPTFSEYAIAVARVGGRAVYVPFADMAAYIDTCEHSIDAAFLCNPNNPTGSIAPQCRILDIAASLKGAGATLVVDEAFIDFVDAPDSYTVRRHVVDGVNLVVLGSLTKFFALPGLRVGYAVAPRQIAVELRRARQAWSVNCLAQVAAVASLRDADYVNQTREYVKREREFLLGGLDELAGQHGFTVWPPAANYIMLTLSPDSPAASGEVRRLMAERGILTRDCSNFMLLNDRSLRVAVRTRDENIRLLNELNHVLTAVRRGGNHEH